MNVLLQADEANKLNDAAKGISPNLFIFCNYEPIPPNFTEDYAGRLLLEINNFYKLFMDCGWVIRKFPYIYSGKRKTYFVPFDSKSIYTIHSTLKDLRSGFCHNISANNGQCVTIENIKAWFRKFGGSSPIEYESLVEEIEANAEKIIDICKQFINSVKALPPEQKNPLIERWKEVIIERYTKKREFFYYIAVSYYNCVKKTQEDSKQVFKIAEEIIISYFNYDFEQARKHLNEILTKGASENAIKAINNKLVSIEKCKKDRAYALFGVEDSNLLYPTTYKEKEKLINKFFETELSNTINNVLEINPQYSLWPQDIFNEILKNTESKFEDIFNSPFKRFSFDITL